MKILSLGLLLTIGAAPAAGCTAEVHTAHPVAVEDEVEVDTVPVEVNSYPHTEYRGQTVYYVNGRWGHPHGRHWSYYRSEPPELVRHRQRVEQAPPARRVYESAPNEAVRVR